MMKKNNKKGFTLAELLIVVAIIAVLVAIAIPVFSAQLKKAQQATELANIRSAYAEAVADKMAAGSFTSSGKLVVSFANPNTDPKCNVSVKSGTVIVTHAADSKITGSFEIDDNVSLTIS